MLFDFFPYIIFFESVYTLDPTIELLLQMGKLRLHGI